MSIAYVAVCALAFVVCYFVTIATTSIGYHRGLAHRAVTLREPYRRALLAAGIWLTSIDPKGWVVMHRLHHAHSDTPEDPHSPRNVGRRGLVGFVGMFKEQILGYHHVLERLRANDERYTSIGHDLESSWPIRSGNSWLPILLHVALALLVVLVGGGWLLAAAIFSGFMSHVVQGAIINFFGHAYGSRNFASGDDSRNNHVAAWLLLGEGFQNNHHRYPSSARFSYRRSEVDLGWAVCLALEKLHVLDINREDSRDASCVDAGCLPAEFAACTRTRSRCACRLGSAGFTLLAAAGRKPAERSRSACGSACTECHSRYGCTTCRRTGRASDRHRPPRCRWLRGRRAHPRERAWSRHGARRVDWLRLTGASRAGAFRWLRSPRAQANRACSPRGATCDALESRGAANPVRPRGPIGDSGHQPDAEQPAYK